MKYDLFSWYLFFSFSMYQPHCEDHTFVTYPMFCKSSLFLNHGHVFKHVLKWKTSNALHNERYRRTETWQRAHMVSHASIHYSTNWFVYSHFEHMPNVLFLCEHGLVTEAVILSPTCHQCCNLVAIDTIIHIHSAAIVNRTHHIYNLNMIWYYMIWYMIWDEMTWHDMVWFDTSQDKTLFKVAW